MMNKTRFEHIKTLSLDEMANWLCDCVSENFYENCDGCIAKEYCKYPVGNGMIDWLQQPYSREGSEE